MKHWLSKTIIVCMTILISVNCSPNPKGSKTTSLEENLLGFLLFAPTFFLSGSLSEKGKITSDNSQASVGYIDVTTAGIGAGSLSISDINVLASIVDQRIGPILKNRVKRSAQKRNYFTIDGGGTDGNGTFALEGDINGESISFFMMDQEVGLFPGSSLICPIQQTYVDSMYNPQGFATVAAGGQVIVNGVTEWIPAPIGPGEVPRFYGTTKISGNFTFADYGKSTIDDAAFVRVLTPEGVSEIMAPYNDPSLTPCEQAQQSFRNGDRILSRYFIIRSGTADITTEMTSINNGDGSKTYTTITDIHSPDGLEIERRNYPDNINQVLETKLVRFDHVRFMKTETSNYSFLGFMIDRKVTVDGTIDEKTVHEELHGRIGR
ncbi:hypothetical protein AB3N59_00805 [Leptospira sp. WS92.C1]